MPLKIQIQLDYRERTLLDTLRPLVSGKPDLELAPPGNLLVGDINLLAIGELGQTQHQLIIERKSYADLIASIKDGRYKEQKLRLQAACTQNIWATRFIYLIESGTQPDDQTGALFYGSWVSMALRDNIPVIRVLSIAEGALFITRLADRLVKDAGDLIPEPSNATRPTSSAAAASTNPGQIGSSSEQSNIRQIIITPRGSSQITNFETSNISGATNSVNATGGEDVLGSEKSEYTRAVIGGIKTKKGDNMTRELCHKTMLSIIPGISAGLCEQILAGYSGSISRLIRSLELVEGGPDTKETRIAQLATTEIKTSTGKVRKLGPVVAQRIWDYLAPV